MEKSSFLFGGSICLCYVLYFFISIPQLNCDVITTHSQLMEEKQRQHCEEQENIDELKRYREETAEENKVGFSITLQAYSFTPV